MHVCVWLWQDEDGEPGENPLPAPVMEDQPGVVVLDEVGTKAVVMAVTVSNHSSVRKKEEEKLQKSQDLSASGQDGGACRSPGDRSTWGCDPPQPEEWLQQRTHSQ